METYYEETSGVRRDSGQADLAGLSPKTGQGKQPSPGEGGGRGTQPGHKGDGDLEDGGVNQPSRALAKSGHGRNEPRSLKVEA